MSGIRRGMRAAVVVIVGVGLLYGCTDEPTGSTPDVPDPSFSVSTAYGPVSDVPAVTMDMPPEPRAWDTEDSALVAVLEREEGVALVGLKLPASQRVADSGGYRAALPADGFAEALEALERSGAEVLHVLRSIGAAAVRIDPEAAPELRGSPWVDYLEPRQWYTLAGAPSSAGALNAMIASSSSQVIPRGMHMIRGPEAWAVETGDGVKVLVIDSGINPHEDLPTIPSSNCGGTFGCTDSSPYHGTHVAGILLARDNDFGVVGAAPGIAGSEVYAWGACNSAGCSSIQVAAGIDAAYTTGARIINLSLGGLPDQGIANAVAAAWANGKLLIAAAGNIHSEQTNGMTFYPAAYSNVIGVSGVRQDKTFAASSPCLIPGGGSVASNFGSHVDIAAPFWALSTVGTDEYEDESYDWCGTSMSTPHVTGAAALVWAQNPTWTNHQVRARLYATAEDRGVTGWDSEYGYGIVDAAAAVGAPPPPSLSVSITGPTVIRPGATCTWTAVVGSGTAPYAYSWFNNWGPVGSDYSYTGSKPAGSGGSSFNLEVRVSDSLYLEGFDSITVHEDPLAPLCPI